jgi:hypothetical protein
MKFVITDLKIGDALTGRVEELLEGGDVIMNFNGDLLRVHNETHRNLRLGDQVVAVVKGIKPLHFQLKPSRSENRRRGHIDVNI